MATPTKRPLDVSDAAGDSASPKKPRADSAPPATAASSSTAAAKTPVESRVEFTSDHLVTAARDSARCISVSLDVERLFRDARVVYLTDDKASWVYYIPKWFRRIYTHCHAERELALPYADWFQRVWALHPAEPHTIKMFGKEVATPRFMQTFGVSYRVSGSEIVAKPIPPELELVAQLLRAMVVSAQTGQTYLKSMLVNWFAHGDHCIGAHSDDETHLHYNSPVFSLSLGATRRFVMTPRKEVAPRLNAKKMEFLVGDGDLIVMGGTTQKTHKHAVPRMKTSAGKRMSVTMRCYKGDVTFEMPKV